MGLLLRGPQSAGELLDVAFAMTKRHLWSLLALAALPLAVALAIDITLRRVGAGSTAELLAVIPVFVCMAIAESRMIVAAWQLLHQRAIDPVTARAQVRANVFAISVAYSVKWMLAMIGILLLVVPGVLVLLWWFAVPTATVLEQRGPWDSMRRSRALSRGNLGRVLATVGVFDLATIVFSIGFTMLLTDPETAQLPLWADVTSWTVTVLLVPLRAALMVAVYVDSRIRHEGYDVEAAAAQLPGAA